MSQPDYDLLLAQIWGNDGGLDSSGLLPLLATASNVIVGCNPPYSITDFLAMYSNFGGIPTVVTGTLTANSNAVTAPTVPAGAPIRAGNYVTGLGVPPGTTVATYVAASGMTPAVLTLSAEATVSGTPVSLNIYTAPLIPAVVLNAYLYAASSSIQQGRWQELWSLGMGLYIAHFCTLWARANGRQASTAGQLATMGLALGLQTSKGADGVSVGYQYLADMEGWGSFGLTLYGEEFVTWAKALGSGGMLLH